MVTNIALSFEIGCHSGRSLGLDIYAHDQVIYHNQKFNQSNINLEFSIDLPGQLIFDISGRHEDDTIVNSQGKILHDQYIHFTKISLDGFDIDTWKIPSSHLFYHDQTLSHCFWNRNGQATLVIDESDAIIWILNHKTIVGVPE